MIDKIHVVVKTPSGGAWHTAMLSAKEWSDAGHDVEITSFLNDPLPHVAGIKTNPMMFKRRKGKRLNRPLTVAYSLYLMILWFLKEKPTMILSVGLPISSPIMILNYILFWQKTRAGMLIETHPSAHLSYKKNQHNSLTFRAMSFVTHNRSLYRWMMNRVSNVICLSQAIADDLMNNYGLKKDKIHVIPPFIDSEFFEHELPVKRPSNKILSVGRLSSEKNLSDLLKAFKIVLEEKADAILDIVGEGECFDGLKVQSQNLGIERNIIFHGAQYNVHDYHLETTVQVLSSHYEGFPLVLVEACANGVPMVSYDGVFGPRDIIIDGVNGYVVPQYDVDALAGALIKALDRKWDSQVIRDSASQFHTRNVKVKIVEFIEVFLGVA